MTERTTLAAELQAVMARKGATEWSKVLDVDRTTVHKWWAGDAYPRGKQLEAIARETGRQLRFVEDDQEPDPPRWARTLTDEIKSEVRRVVLGDDDDEESMVARVLARLEAQLGPLERRAGGDPGRGNPGDA